MYPSLIDFKNQRQRQPFLPERHIFYKMRSFDVQDDAAKYDGTAAEPILPCYENLYLTLTSESRKYLIPNITEENRKYLIPNITEENRKYLIPHITEENRKYLIPNITEENKKDIIPHITEENRKYLIPRPLSLEDMDE